MKKEKYYVALDEYEHGVVIRSLNDERTDLKKQGKSTDAVDDLIQTERAKIFDFCVSRCVKRLTGLAPVLVSTRARGALRRLSSVGVQSPTELRMVPTAYRGGGHLAGVIKIGRAPTKKFKVTEKEKYCREQR